MAGYRMERYSKRASKFVVKNSTSFAPPGQEADRLPPVVSGVWLHIVEMDGELKVMMEVGEGTTHANLREAETYALMWRDRLIDQQGPWSGGGDTAFKEHLHILNKGGVSYANLAMWVNSLIASHLCEFSAFQSRLEEARSQGEEKEYLNRFPLDDVPNPFSFSFAVDLLGALGIREEESEPMLIEGLQRIKEGLPPFEEGYPISRDKMISVLRTWRSNKKHAFLKQRYPNHNSDRNDLKV